MTDFPRSIYYFLWGKNVSPPPAEKKNPSMEKIREEDDFLGFDLCMNHIVKKIFGNPQNSSPNEKIGQINDAENSSGTINDQTKNLKAQLKKILSDLEILEQYFTRWNNTFSEYGNQQGSLLTILDYFNLNHDNFITILSCFIKSESYEKLGGQFETLDNAIKFTNCLTPFVLNIIKIYFLFLIQYDLETFYRQFSEMKVLINALSKECEEQKFVAKIKEIAEDLNKKVNQNRSEAYKNLKIEKFAGKISALPLWHYGKMKLNDANKAGKSVFAIFFKFKSLFKVKKASSIRNKMIFHFKPRIVVKHNYSKIDQEKLYDEVENFLLELQNCSTREGTEKKLKEISVKINNLPYDLCDWLEIQKTHHFKRFIAFSYYHCVGKRPFMNADHIEALLKKRSQDREIKVQEAQAIINEHVNKTQNLTFPEITLYFKKNLDIYLERVPLPSNTSLEKDWNTLIKNPEFISALSNQWVHYQETNGRLLLQSLREISISKCQAERNFLFFHGFEFLIGILASLLQLLILKPTLKIRFVTSLIEFFISDITKAGLPLLGILHLFNPLYPNVKFKVDNILVSFLEQRLGTRFKPNEYSFEGYKLSIQIRWFTLVSITYYLISLLKHALLYLNIRFIENGIFKKQRKSLEEDSRYIQIAEKLEQQRIICQQQIQDLNLSLDNLKLEDLKLLLINDVEKKYDPIKVFFNTLKKSNVDFFPKDVHEGFEEITGVKLSESNKPELERRIRNFILSSGNKFLNMYQKNYSKYLKRDRSPTPPEAIPAGSK